MLQVALAMEQLAWAVGDIVLHPRLEVHDSYLSSKLAFPASHSNALHVPVLPLPVSAVCLCVVGGEGVCAGARARWLVGLVLPSQTRSVTLPVCSLTYPLNNRNLAACPLPKPVRLLGTPLT